MYPRTLLVLTAGESVASVPFFPSPCASLQHPHPPSLVLGYKTVFLRFSLHPDSLGDGCSVILAKNNSHKQILAHLPGLLTSSDTVWMEDERRIFLYPRGVTL